MNLTDNSIQMKFAIFIKNIILMYKEETEGLREKLDLPTHTKSGREVKRPKKLDL